MSSKQVLIQFNLTTIVTVQYLLNYPSQWTSYEFMMNSRRTIKLELQQLKLV